MTEKPAKPKLSRTPHCKSCGTTVALGKDFCDVCEQKQGKAPEFAHNLTVGRRPPYEKPAAINPQET